jgi:aspartyl-tRNA(Asn)/glutamyl-tRNA(Gln) amidotransferase subunit B
MEKGVIRFEANVSVRPKTPLGADTAPLGTRTEVKNLNSFRALERSILYEIDRQSRILESGGVVEQETLGWSEDRGETYPQRSKEEAHDYRYFPEPDLPPLIVEPDWVKRIAAGLPELPYAKYRRFVDQYGLNNYNAWRLTEERALADYFEQAAASAPPQAVANMILGDLLALVNRSAADGGTAEAFARPRIAPHALADLVRMIGEGQINLSTGKEVLGEMYTSGNSAGDIVDARGLRQVSDQGSISDLVAETLRENPKEVESYRAGKTAVSNFLFGQVMKKAGGKANPQVVRTELEKLLSQ